MIASDSLSGASEFLIPFVQLAVPDEYTLLPLLVDTSYPRAYPKETAVLDPEPLDTDGLKLRWKRDRFGVPMTSDNSWHMLHPNQSL